MVPKGPLVISIANEELGIWWHWGNSHYKSDSCSQLLVSTSLHLHYHAVVGMVDVSFIRCPSQYPSTGRLCP